MDENMLRAECAGTVLTPLDAGYVVQARGWNTSVALHPEVIVVAAGLRDVQLAITFATARSLKLLVRSTGHGVAQTAEPHVLLVTSELNSVSIDLRRSTARIQAGATWGEVLAKTAPHGLAPLLGSSPSVGVVGYTLGGGLGWLTRPYGPAVDSVINIDVVTAANALLRVSADSHPELLWALCGAGGGFAVVTAIEVQLHPVTTVFGGMLAYPLSDALPVFRRYRDWTATLPTDFTTSLAIGYLPDRRDVPVELRGSRALMLRGVFSGRTPRGADHLSSFAEWGRLLFNTFTTISFADVASISADPEEPSPAFTVGGQTFSGLPEALLDTLAQYAAMTDSPFIEIELRHIGTTSTPLASNCYPHRDAHYVLDVVAGAITSEEVASVRHHGAVLQRAVQGHVIGRFLSLADTAAAADAFTPSVLRRLEAIKDQFDPGGLLISGFSFASLR